MLAALERSLDLDGRPIGHVATTTVVITFASWCTHCQAELAVLERVAHPDVRVLGVNYRGHEEYASRGGSAQLAAFLTHVPWLRVVPADDALFAVLGRPPLVPTMWIFDRHGQLIDTFDRRERTPPAAADLEALFVRLGR